MSTWNELFKVDPGLLEAARELSKRWATSLTHTRIVPFRPRDEVIPSQLLALLVWTELRKVERHYQEAALAERSWLMLGTAVVGGRIIQYFKNRAGELVALPDAFVRTFLEGRRLDAELVEDEADPSQVVLRRGGKNEAVFPKTLLDFLGETAARSRRDFPRNPTSHPISRLSGIEKAKSGPDGPGVGFGAQKT